MRNLLTEYAYDALDRLASYAPSAQAQRICFYKKNILTTETQDTVTYQIFQQSGILLAEKHGGPADHASLLAIDNQRSVLMSDIRKTAYTPYGHRNKSKDFFSPLGFNGERRDTTTGHYLLGNGHRAFNPVLMRFNSPDSLSPFDKGGLNCYAYCGGDPVNRIDPTGKWNVHGWLANALLEIVGDYVVPYIPKRAVTWIPGVGNRRFGQFAKAASKIGGVVAAGSYVALNRFDAHAYTEPLYNKLFAGFLVVSTVSTLSTAASTLHKIARKGWDATPMLVRYSSNQPTAVETVQRTVSTSNPNINNVLPTSFNEVHKSGTAIRNGRH